MKFAFLGYHVEQNWEAMSEGEQDAMLEECFGYDAKLLKDGHIFPEGVPLQSSRTAKTLRWHQGAVVVSDGPFAETKELLGGVGMLEAADLGQAVDLLAKHPALRYGSTFEIRPIEEAALQCHEKALAARRGGVPPGWQKFANLGYINGQAFGSLSREKLDAMREQCTAYDEARIQSGQWHRGLALKSPETAKTVRAKAGQVVVTDGPFAETKEFLGGIVVLAFRDESEAVQVLSQHPALPFGVIMELRPIAEAINRRWHEQVKPR